ncbi:MAG: hypothetical protein R3C49_00625 [Planctomycetaceae bacterium]
MIVTDVLTQSIPSVLRRFWSTFLRHPNRRARRQFEHCVTIDALEVRLVPSAATLVSDFNPGPGGIELSRPDNAQIYAEVNGLVYLSLATPGFGSELWRTDGTSEGTQMVVDLYPGATGSEPNNFLVADDFLYFTAWDEQGQAVFRTNGTAAGTQRLKEIPDNQHQVPAAVLPDGSILSLGVDVTRFSPDFSTELAVLPLGDFLPHDVVLQGADAYISAGPQIWVTDGTSDGTRLLFEAEERIARIEKIAPVGDGLFFVSRGSNGDATIWWSDGTPGNTVVVAADSASWKISTTSSFQILNDLAWFTVKEYDADGRVTYGLWTSDGDPQHTSRFSSPALGDYTLFRSTLLSADGQLYFPAYTTSTSGSLRVINLWKTDGTVEGTESLRRPVRTTTVRSNGSQIYFGEDDSLSVYDEDTGSFTSLLSGSMPLSDLQNFEFTDTCAVFAFDDGIHGTELWCSDGTREGTRMIRDLVTSTGNIDATIFPSVAEPDVFYILWRDDSVRGITYHLSGAARSHVFEIAETSTFVSPIMSRSDGLYFRTGEGLWKVRSSSEQPELVGESRFLQGPAIDAGGRMLVIDGNFMNEVWWLDESVSPAVYRSLKELPGTILQAASTGSYAYWSVHESELWPLKGTLWKSDGTEEGTMPLGGPLLRQIDTFAPLIPFGDSLIVHLNPRSDETAQLVITDGTEAGTRPIPGFPDSTFWSISDVVVADTRMFFKGYRTFSAGVNSTPDDVWCFDFDTHELNRLGLGDVLWSVDSLAPAGDRLVFRAHDPIHGVELWISDGTTAGTKLLADVFPGTGSSDPEDIHLTGDTLVFVATDDLHGREVFTLNLGAPRVTGVSREQGAELVTTPQELTFRVNFSEPVSGLNSSTFHVDGKTTAQITDVSMPTDSDGTVWRITVAGGNLSTFNGTVGIRLANPNDVVDADGTAALDTPPTWNETYHVRYFPSAPVVVTSEHTVAGAQPRMTWNAESQAVSAEVWLSRVDINTARVGYSDQVEGSSWTPEQPLTAGRYRFWVRTKDAEGNQSGWSQAVDFHVRVSLRDAAVSSNGQLNFSWDPVPDATYELFVRTLTKDLVFAGLPDAEFSLTENPGPGPVYWWIRAADGRGRRTVWSQRHETRADGIAVVQSVTVSTERLPTIVWSPVSGAVRYILYLAADSVAVPVIREDFLTDSRFTGDSGLAAGSYRVWIKAVHGDDTVTDRWSRAFTFRVE